MFHSTQTGHIKMALQSSRVTTQYLLCMSKNYSIKLEMWANAQRDGRPAEYTWRPLVQHGKVWLTPTTRVPCSNAAKMQNPLKFAGVPQTRQQISGASGLKFTVL